MKKYIFLVLTIISLLFTSCTDFFGKSEEEEFVTISGNITIDTQSTFNNSRSVTQSNRTIIPTYPALSDNSMQCTVYLLNAADDTLVDSKELSAGATSYTISIPVTSEEKSYKISVSAIKDLTHEVLKGTSESFSISYENQVKVQDIVLKPIETSASGGLNLDVNVDSDTGITSARALTDGWYSDATIDDTTFNFSKDVDKCAACYLPVTFTFKNDAGEVLYSFTQEIYICGGIKTNTWVKNGDETYLETSTIEGVTTTTCHITKALVDRYALSTIYIDISRQISDSTASTYTTQSGTFLNPCINLNTALTKLKNKDIDYTIFIKGEIHGSLHSSIYTMEIPDTLKKDGTGDLNARSLTLCGLRGLNEEGVPQDGLNGVTAGTVLQINTEVPVIIKNLKIYNGRGTASQTGGGIYSKGHLTLGSGTLITSNSTQSWGGGVYNDSGTLIIQKGAKISANEERNLSTGDFGGAGIHNYAGKVIMTGGIIEGNIARHKGAGVFNENDQADKEAVFEMSGGQIHSNSANEDGGGIYCKGQNSKIFLYGTAVIGNDKVTEIAQAADNKHSNSAKNGGGIYLESKAEFYMGYKHDADGNPEKTSYIGGIYYNYASNTSTVNDDKQGGGGIFTTGESSDNKSVIKINDGTIAFNYTPACGGGLLFNFATFTFTGGIIKNNDAGKGKGAARLTSSSIYWGNTATITEDNDFFTVQGIQINVESPLSPVGGIAAFITPGAYVANTVTLKVQNTAGTNLAAEYKKFLITPQVVSSVTTCWGLDFQTGKMKKLIGKKNRPDAKYDIVFNDGSATAYSSGLSLSDTEQAAAIAVIFYIGTDCSNDGTTVRKLGVGLKQSSSKLKFISGPLENQYISPIRCWIPDGHRTPTEGWQINPGEDVNGSDNLEQIKQYLLSQGMEDNTNDSSKYPLFYFAKNYASQTGSNVSGTDYAEGWYIPSSYELAHIFWEPYDGNTCTLFKVNQALNKCGGTQLRVSESDPNNEFLYGSSSRNDTSFHPAIKIGNFEYNYIEAWDAEICYAIAIHEF